MSFCKKCGYEYSDNDVFCNKCGVQLNEGKTEQVTDLNAQNISNTIIWWVAFMPLIGLVIENAFAIIFSTPIVNLWWITLIINIILCYIDQYKIKKTYPDLSLLKAWFVLIPVYLFKRAKALKQNFSYFIVWIVMFCIISFVPQSFVLNNLLFNFGLGSSQTVTTVKNGTFSGYLGMSVGQAIDNYLVDEKWTSFNMDNGQQIVQVEGKTTYIEGKFYSILIQFTVNGSAPFNMTYISVDGQSQDSNYFKYFLDVIYGKQ